LDISNLATINARWYLCLAIYVQAEIYSNCVNVCIEEKKIYCVSLLTFRASEELREYSEQ